jgi:hypothetical protein
MENLVGREVCFQQRCGWYRRIGHCKQRHFISMYGSALARWDVLHVLDFDATCLRQDEENKQSKGDVNSLPNQWPLVYLKTNISCEWETYEEEQNCRMS